LRASSPPFVHVVRLGWEPVKSSLLLGDLGHVGEVAHEVVGVIPGFLA
jgi:hypothetical protein